MSLDKAIKYGKEKRKPYRKAKAVDKSCRNHGSCKWCKDNRTYKSRKRESEINDTEDPVEMLSTIIEIFKEA